MFDNLKVIKHGVNQNIYLDVFCFNGFISSLPNILSNNNNIVKMVYS
jgi:hypothetical protein